MLDLGFNLLATARARSSALPFDPVVGDLVVHSGERRRRRGHDLAGRDHRIALVVRQA